MATCNKTSQMPMDGASGVVHMIRCVDEITKCDDVAAAAAGDCEMVDVKIAEMFLDRGSHVLALTACSDYASVPSFNGEVAEGGIDVVIALTLADGATVYTYKVQADADGNWELTDLLNTADDGGGTFTATEFGASALIKATVSATVGLCGAVSVELEGTANSGGC